jgi:DNA-binding transcriptional LysR family regulator
MLAQVGELFPDHAQRAMRELEQASQLVQELHGTQRGRLVVGTLATENSYLLAPLVS